MKTLIATRKNVKYEVLVDDEDFDRLNQFRWYVTTNIGHRTIYAYRKTGPSTKLLIHRDITGASPDQQVDHKDCNGLNNVRSNLRVCSHTENQRNQRTQIRANKSSRFKGVGFNKNARKYEAAITIEKTRHALGLHTTEEAGAIAYDIAAGVMFGRYAKLNHGEAFFDQPLISDPKTMKLVSQAAIELLRRAGKLPAPITACQGRYEDAADLEPDMFASTNSKMIR